MRSVRGLVRTLPVCCFLAAGCHHAMHVAELTLTGERPAPKPIPTVREKARQGLGRFLQKLRTPTKDDEYFSVAVPGRLVGAAKDNVWVDGLKVSGDTFEGRVVSRRPGKVVKFTCDDVCDWMIVGNNGVVGAYSLR